MDIDLLLDDLNVKDSPPKKGVLSMDRNKEKSDEWGDTDMIIDTKNAGKKVLSATHKQ